MKKNIQLLWMLLIIIMLRGVSYAQSSDRLVIGSGDMLRSEQYTTETIPTNAIDYHDTPVTDMLINEGIAIQDSYPRNDDQTDFYNEDTANPIVKTVRLQLGTSDQEILSIRIPGLTGIPSSLVRFARNGMPIGFSIADF